MLSILNSTFAKHAKLVRQMSAKTMEKERLEASLATEAEHMEAVDHSMLNQLKQMFKPVAPIASYLWGPTWHTKAATLTLTHFIRIFVFITILIATGRPHAFVLSSSINDPTIGWSVGILPWMVRSVGLLFFTFIFASQLLTCCGILNS
jgi:hypothetical protein